MTFGPRLLDLALALVRALVRWQPGPRPLPPPRPAPVLPAEARGHILDPTLLRRGVVPVWYCPRCGAVGTHAELGDIVCVPMRAPN